MLIETFFASLPPTSTEPLLASLLSDSLEFGEPQVLAALLLPLLLLVLSKAKVRPIRRATGSLRLWKRLDESDHLSSEAARKQTPPALWFLIGSLICACFAAADPYIPAGQKEGRLWQVVVDRSASMYLSVLPTIPYTGLAALGANEPIDRGLCPPLEAGAAMRIESALDMALVALRTTWAAGDRVIYKSPGRDPIELTEPEAPPASWLAPDENWRTPDFAASDVSGNLLVTDREFPVEFASLFASGGAEVPGLIGRRSNQKLFWRDGEVYDEVAAEPRVVRVFSQGNGPVVQLLETWCSARGFTFLRANTESVTSDAALDFHQLGLASSDSETIAIGRDGWTLEVASSEAANEPLHGGRPLTSWLRSGERNLVTWSPGLLFVNWSASDEAAANQPGGDPATFALSWSKLFDRAVSPEFGAVSLAERQSAGEASASSELTAKESGQGQPKRRLDFAFAVAAAVCAFIGAFRLK